MNNVNENDINKESRDNDKDSTNNLPIILIIRIIILFGLSTLIIVINRRSIKNLFQKNRSC